MSETEKEIRRLQGVVSQIKDSLEAIGPTHVLYYPFRLELAEAEGQLKAFEKLLK
jgi:hypothetical protein